MVSLLLGRCGERENLFIGPSRPDLILASTLPYRGHAKSLLWRSCETVFFGDPTFVQLKPTIIYVTLGLALLALVAGTAPAEMYVEGYIGGNFAPEYLPFPGAGT